MRKLALLLAAIIGFIPATAFAQNGGYILVNDNVETANSASAFKVTSAGKMSFFRTVDTGGVGENGGAFAIIEISIESSAHCMFVSDAASNDIAAFEGPTFRHITPNFSNSQLQGNLYGIGLAVDPAGKFLYTSWSATANLAVLSIGSDCSLSLVGSPIPQPDFVDGMSLTHNGKILVVGYPDIGGAQAYTTSSSGTLTALGPALSFNDAIPDCANVGCFPAGQDSTDDGVYWVWGNATILGPYTLSATLTSKGFTNAVLQTYTTTLRNVEFPWFSPEAAQTDAGNLYLGASGGGPGFPAGIMVTTFTNGTISYDSEVVNSSVNFAGAIQTVGTTGTGSPLVQIGESSNTTLFSYAVNGTTLTPASSLNDNVSSGSFSIVAFPKRP